MRRSKTLINLEMLNTLNEGCAACGGKFTLGEEVVLARGDWDGFKYIHEGEAYFDRRAGTYRTRGHEPKRQQEEP